MTKRIVVWLIACVLVAGLPVGAARAEGCADDALEDNDTLGQATPLTEGTGRSAVICAQDDDLVTQDLDLFSLVVTEGRRVTATVTFEHDQGDLDLTVRDGGGYHVGFSASTDDVEEFSFVAVESDTYYFIVSLFLDPGPTPYTVTVTTTEVPCTIVGSEEKDKMKGTAGDDVICALGGNDVVNGKAGNDVIFGGPGNDKLSGAAGIDTALGGDGDDRVNGNGDRDYLSGNGGIDKINGGGSPDYCPVANEKRRKCEFGTPLD